jgi:hypothetical protein
LYASGTYELFDGGVERAKELNEQFNMTQYHRPQDEFDGTGWDFSGIQDDGMLFYQVGLDLANSGQWPKWKEGSEFKAIREGN